MSRRWKLFGLNSSSRFGGKPAFTGLLNQFPGAAFGASVRLLDNNYTGGLIRVRAWDGLADQGQADVMPYQIGSEKWVNMNSRLTNLDATAIGRGLTTSSTLADLVDSGGSNYDGYVPKWYEQSGNANDGVQTTATLQPTIVESGVLNLENGKPSINFNGLNSHFVINTIGLFSNGVHTFAINKPTITGYRALFYYYDGVSNATGVYNSAYGIYIPVGVIAGIKALTGFGSTPNSNQQLSNVYYDGIGDSVTDATLKIDNSVTPLTTSGSWGTIKSSSAIGFYPGGSILNGYQGSIQEIATWLEDKTTEEVAIQNNINTAFTIY